MKKNIYLFFLLDILLTFTNVTIAQNTNNYYNLAKQYIAEENYKDAIIILSELIEADSINFSYYSDLGFANFKSNNLKLAIKNYENAILLNKDCLDCYINLAKIFYDIKSYDDAEKSINNAFEINKEISDLYFIKGQIYNQKNEKELSIDNYKKAIMLDKNNFEYLISKANTHIKYSEYNYAYNDLSEAIKIKPNNPSYYYYRSYTLLNLNLLNEALIDINQAISLNDNIADYYNLKFSILISMKEYIQSEACLLKSIEILPTDYNAYVNLGDMYFQIGEYESYCNCYKNAIINISKSSTKQHNDLESNHKKFCKDSEISYYYIRALSEFNNNDFDKSIVLVDQGLKINNNSPILHNIKGAIFLAKKEYISAEKEFNKCIELKDLLPDEIIKFYKIKLSLDDAKLTADSYIIKSLLGIAIVKLINKDYNSSEIYIDNAIQIAERIKNFSGIEYLYNIKAIIYISKGNLIFADSELSKALKINSRNTITLLNIAIYELLSVTDYGLKDLNFEYYEQLKIPRLIFPNLTLKINSEKKLNDVIQLCDKILESDPKNSYAFLIKAKVAQLLNMQNSCEFAKKANEFGINSAFLELNINCN